MVHAGVTNKQLTGASYKNLDFNPNTGVVNVLGSFNVAQGSNLDLIFRIINSANGATIKTVTVNKSFSSTTSFVSHNLTTTFPISNTPPSKVNISMQVVQVNINPNIQWGTVTITDIPFTGSFPVIDPTIDMVNLALIPKSLTSTRLEFESFAEKSASFPASFDNRALKLIVQVKDTSGTVLVLGEIPFVFGSNPTFTKNTIITGNFPSEIDLKVVCWTADN